MIGRIDIGPLCLRCPCAFVRRSYRPRAKVLVCRRSLRELVTPYIAHSKSCSQLKDREDWEDRSDRVD